MAVYTEVTPNDLDLLLKDFDLGTQVALEGIQGGIENTNYFVTLEQDKQQQRYVLTLFEELSEEELPFFVELAQWQAKRGIPLPYGIPDRNGIAQKRLNDRPALLQPCFSGRIIDRTQLTPEHCAQVGTALAQFHKAGEDFYLKRQAHRGVFWWRSESSRIQSHLPEEDAKLLLDEVAAFDELRDHADKLPSGVIHGDLFHDNVLFDGDQLSAILDIYNAATAFWLFDLAIVANDWCSLPDGSIDSERENALLSAYHAERPFVEFEYEAWPILTRTAAMRFWLSRLLPALGLEDNGDNDKKIKDPDELKQILLSRLRTPGVLPR
ncbi:homoserine kinase [Pontibacterium sp.]|uniref:homoserine kinase n=1 Tax=Pontibacterium sp. TaxID=2036026 RepID=UPI003517A188